MRGYIATVLLLTAGTANAGLVATAQGVITSGCSDCDSTGYADIWNLGANADLAGQAFTIEYFLTDQSLANPRFNTRGFDLIYSDYQDFNLSCSVTLNNVTYNMPFNSVSDQYFGFNADGSKGLLFQNEYGAPPPGYDPPRYGGVFNNFVWVTTGGLTQFLSDWQVVDHGASQRSHFTRTQFNGQVGEFTVAAQVPEPGTLALMGAGLVGMALSRRRLRAPPA